MGCLEFRLSFPESTSLDDIVSSFVWLRRAADLFPLKRMSPLFMLNPESVAIAEEDASHPLSSAVCCLRQKIPIRFDHIGVPWPCSHKLAETMINMLPRRVIGMTVQPGFECDALDLVVADYVPNVLVLGNGPTSTFSFPISTGTSDWVGEGFFSSGGHDSTLGDFILSHLCAVALLVSAQGLGMQVEVADSTNFWTSRSFADLMAAFPGETGDRLDQEEAEAVEPMYFLATIVNAVDAREFLPGDLS